MEKDTNFEHLEGLIAATFTPFHEDGQINLEPIPAMVEHLSKCSIKGIFINGTTGEGPSLTEEERITLAESFVSEAKKYNIKYSGGLKMLVEQAKPSYEIWSGNKIEIDRKIYQMLINKI